MNVKKLIDVLRKGIKKEDRGNSEIELWVGEQQYDIVGISNFALSTDIIVELEPIKTPIMKELNIKKSIKKEHQGMVKKTLKAAKNKIAEEQP